jgi:Zn-dependent protease with chaperone function
MRNRNRYVRTVTQAFAIGAILAWAAPANAFLDKLFGDEQKPVKQTEKFKPADPEKYRALTSLREKGLALARSTEFGILPPSALTEYVNDVLKKIVRASPVPDIDVHAVVTPQQGMQAQATVHGIIYVAWEMLKTMNTEDELAAILGHELAHILYQHHDTDWFAKTQKYAVFDRALHRPRDGGHQPRYRAKFVVQGPGSRG